MDANSFARHPCSSVFIRGFLFLLLFIATTHAQVPKNVSAKGINMPYFEGTVLKAFFTAETADPSPDGNILATGFKMLSYGPGGTNDVQFVVTAPKCVFDYERKTAWSSGPLKVYSVTTNYLIEGEGFFCRQTLTNALLNVSNRVHTILQRETGTNASPAPPIDVFADRLYFTSDTTNGIQRRVATYVGHVRAEDPEIGLRSDKLALVLPQGSNKVHDVVATGNVIITNKTEGSQATGQRAVYLSDMNREIVTLTGNPTWRDANNESSAETFIFDRRNKMAFAQKNARLKMPRGDMAPQNFASAQTNTVTTTNQFIDVTSEFMDIYLAITNQTTSATNQTRNVLIRQNVVITSPADKLRATSDEAFFEGATGTLYLRSNAVWQTDQLLATGTFLTLDRSNNVFSAQENAYLKIMETKPAASTTNRSIEIFCAHYQLRTNTSYFHDKVRLQFQSSNSLSQLVCENMEAYLTSNQVKTVVARQDAILEQMVVENPQTRLQKKLRADMLTINRSMETGLIESLFAQNNVELLQIGAGTNPPTQLCAQNVEMQFGKTNQLERLIADGDVEIESGVNKGKGQHAVYSMLTGEETFELTGNPIATVERVQQNGSRQQMLISNADWLNWNPKNGKVKARGLFRIDPISNQQSSTNESAPGSNIQPVEASQ